MLLIFAERTWVEKFDIPLKSPLIDGRLPARQIRVPVNASNHVHNKVL